MKNETKKGLTDKATEMMMDALNKVNIDSSPIQAREKILVASDMLEIIKGLDGIKTDEERETEQMAAEELRGVLERGRAARAESRALYEKAMENIQSGRPVGILNSRCD